MRATVFAAAALVCVATLAAQTITGSIVGSVKDPSGLPVAGAEVKLVQPATGVARQTRSSDRGDFSFPSLPPGEYSLTIKAPGFKSVEQTSLKLSASETLPAGDLTLEVGSVSKTVTVTAQGAVVQTLVGLRTRPRKILAAFYPILTGLFSISFRYMPQCGNTRAHDESNGQCLPSTIQNQIRFARGKALHGLQQMARTDLGKQ